jgi:aryl-alcohol dehydrogenase-like predicted oxidoreductase
LQNRYSITDRGAEDVLQYCEKENLGFIPWFPLAAGKVSGAQSTIGDLAKRWNATPSQVALAWLLSRSRVILPIPGTSKVKHLEENVAAAEFKMDESKMEELQKAA